ncbi:MAG TPA: Holliday junction resolvase RuvX [Candidatus Dormibacteraeota bacterium]|nr:Holliday junction resolvase RuvX [Candidatus Dormibacteraeota bacterium]
MAILAIDFGERRIGLAASDPSDTMAFPLQTLERTNREDDARRIAEAARERGIRDVVIGMPLTLRGERGPAAQKVEAFAELVRSALPEAAIHFVDERMTTAEVTKTLIAADVSRKQRKRVVDGMAAALILQTYLARAKRP